MTEQRIEREVIGQHRRLDALFTSVRASFAAERGTKALRAALARLQEALEVHFLQEDALYCPALGSLRPQLRVHLEACMALHAALRAQLREVEQRVERRERAGALRASESLAEDFRRHEVREEQVLHDLDQPLAAAPEPS